MNVGFSPCRLLVCQELKAVRILLGRIDQSRLYRVHRNIVSMLHKISPIEYLYLRKPALPYFSQMSKLFCQAMGKPALDKLHGLFNRHSVFNCQKQMNVIRHDHEIVQLELLFCHKGPQHIDEKSCIPFRL